MPMATRCTPTVHRAGEAEQAQVGAWRCSQVSPRERLSSAPFERASPWSRSREIAGDRPAEADPGCRRPTSASAGAAATRERSVGGHGQRSERLGCAERPVWNWKTALVCTCSQSRLRVHSAGDHDFLLPNGRRCGDGYALGHLQSGSGGPRRPARGRRAVVPSAVGLRLEAGTCIAIRSTTSGQKEIDNGSRCPARRRSPLFAGSKL